MKVIPARVKNLRLQHLLVIGFVLTTAISVGVGSLITQATINNYLEGAEDTRVGRDMNLANAFYNNKRNDIAATAGRLASSRGFAESLAEAARGEDSALTAIDAAIDNELANLPVNTQRFVVVTDAEGRLVTGAVALDERPKRAEEGTDWSSLPAVRSVMSSGQPIAATEVIPAPILAWIGLEEQAQIPLKETEKAAPEPYDAREGAAGLVVLAAQPVLSDDGHVVGSVVAGHLFNNDFTLVDRIKEVAGVDTVTIFFGDLRVSTNVLDEEGERAIGTRVSQEVFDRVLLRGLEFTGPAFVVNQWYITRYEPLYDHQGQVVGILYVGAKRASFQRLLDSFRRWALLIAAFSVLLAVVIAVPVAWSLTRPVTSLVGATRQVAHGDWSVRVQSAGPREMGLLADSFNTMVGTLQETQEQLVQKEKLASVGQLAAGVAHEINNPLGSVLLYADILRKETPEEDEQHRSDLEMIINEATRCKTIVNDLLNFSRQNEVLAQDTDLNALLAELAEEAGRQELYQNIAIRTALNRELPHIQADPLQLRQVFINLMSNAAEAMPDGGTLILRTQRGPSADLVTVEVEDTGVGISEENMKRIFTPFFTTKPIGKGTGLGLAIIYGIVKMHRGQINVRSRAGQGTTFTLTLREKLPPLSGESGL